MSVTQYTPLWANKAFVRIMFRPFLPHLSAKIRPSPPPTSPTKLLHHPRLPSHPTPTPHASSPAPLHKLPRLLLILPPPPRQRRPPLHQIPRRPKHPPPIHVHTNLIIRTNHVELPLPHPPLQLPRHLLRRPRPRRLLPAPATASSHARVRPPRHEEVDGRGGVAQVEGEVLGEGLDGGFAGVVGGVARGVGDALFGAGDDDGGALGAVCADGGDEGVEAVDDAEEVGGEGLGGLLVFLWCARGA